MSQLVSKTRKDAPKDETSLNAQLLIKAGFIHKEMAGVYSLLPLGLKVFKNVENVIREEMNSIGGNEISMTALQNPNYAHHQQRTSTVKMVRKRIGFLNKISIFVLSASLRLDGTGTHRQVICHQSD